MVVVVYICEADTKGDRPYVYGPFEDKTIAYTWINTHKKAYLGRWYTTELVKPYLTFTTDISL